MQELINGIVAKSGLPREKVEEAVGVMFNLIKTQGNAAKVNELFAKLPGVEDLVKRQSGSLTGLLAGGMMGGPLAAVTKLQALGLSTAQMREVGTEALAYARKKAGDDLVRQCAANIPGLSGFL